MADDEVITEQIRQLTLTDRFKATDEGDVLMPAADTGLPDPAGGDDPALETIVLDETDLMGTDEFQQLARSAERLNSSVGESIIAPSKLRQLLDPETAGADRSMTLQSRSYHRLQSGMMIPGNRTDC